MSTGQLPVILGEAKQVGDVRVDRHGCKLTPATPVNHMDLSHDGDKVQPAQNDTVIAQEDATRCEVF